MRASVGFSTISRLATAVAALWLWGTGPAWAGGEGGSIGTLQNFLGPSNGSSGFCQLLVMNPFPQVPTLTQLALEISALANSPPDLVRSPAGPSATGTGGLKVCTPAGPTISGYSSLTVCSQTNAINAVNPPPPSSIPPSELASLVPLAFISPKTSTGQAVPVTFGANSFFYAATTEGSGQPDTLSLFFDYPPLTNMTFVKGQQVATISLPLVTLNNKGIEQAVTTILQITATCNGGPSCLTATASGNFFGNGTQTRLATDLGLQFGLVPSQHAIFELQIRLIVTGPTNVSACQAAINL